MLRRALLLPWLLALAAACARPPPPLPERARQGAARAVDYFAAREGRVLGAMLFKLDHLRRKFAQPGLAPVVARWRALDDPAEQAGRLAFARLLEPDQPFPAEARAALTHPYERVLFDGLHCDRQGAPERLRADLARLTREGGYALTHAALASALAAENGCLSPDGLARLRGPMVEGLVRLAESGRAPTDLALEAVATLYALGERARVRPAWLERALGAQRADGGWALRAEDAASHDHASTLGLWVLLEAGWPDARPEPWIPRTPPAGVAR